LSRVGARDTALPCRVLSVLERLRGRENRCYVEGMEIKNLPNQQLLENTDRLAARERELTLEVIEHLREIHRRRAFVELGYPTLWDYVTRGLRYSSGAAKRRIDALHALNDLPELREAVTDGALSLSTVSQVQSFVRQSPRSKGERLELFEAMAGKSSRQVEKSLRALDPEAAAPERVRVVNEQQVELRITVSEELLEKLKRLHGLCAHKLKNPGSYAELLELLAEVGLKELDPGKEVRARRSSAPNEASRRIPSAIRRKIWRRDHGRCTHEGCGSRYAVQVDHVQPYALGGSSTDPGNLRLLCRQHNLHRAFRTFGAQSANRSPYTATGTSSAAGNRSVTARLPAGSARRR
jgi:hypothetical protein